MGSAKMSTAAEKSKPKKSTTKTTKKMEQAHPPSSVMIVKAIEDLKEKKGSSLASIKKYIGANYKVDLTKLSVHIRRALKSGIEKKTITASAGMAGRFKIAKEITQKRRVNRRQSQKHRRRSKHLQRKRQNHRRKQPQKRQKKQNLSRKQQRRSLFRRKQKKGQPLKRLRRKSS